MKISEAEEKLIQGKCNDVMLDQFKNALARVPKANRCQHCYTTAVAMKPPFIKQAISLIEYGLEFCDNWVDRMRSYTNMAIIYENNMDYLDALTSYKKALDAIDSEKHSLYQAEYAAYMMRAEMHNSNFKYTEQLQEFYHIAIQADAFSQSFQKKAFYRAIAEIIIFSHNGDTVTTKKAIETADKMLRADYIGSLSALLKGKGYSESTGATKEAIFFLKKAKKHY